MTKVAVWDVPLRLFHWLLAAAVAALLVTAEVGGNYMTWHGRLGLFVLGLLVFRLLWGFVGSSYARFAQFFPTPNRVRAYLKGEWRGLGHNPIGALSVFGLLGVLTLQVATGLVANDDIGFQGPLYPLLDSRWSELFTGIHHLLAELLQFLLALHVAAIVFYLRIKRINLVRPMLTGDKEVDEANSAHSQARQGGGILAAVVVVTIALAVVWVIGSGHVVQWFAPPPPSIAPPPAW